MVSYLGSVLLSGLNVQTWYNTQMVTINQAIKGFLDIPSHPAGPYILATSGGPDSQCLLKGVSHVVGAGNCIAVGIDHSLRQAASEELDLAEKLANDCGVEFRRIKVTVKKGGSLQAQARNARYDALFQVAREYNTPFVVTGHNKDDQVETLMIKLLRGTTPITMKFHTYFDDICIIRPLLLHTREEILGYLERWDISYAQDPSNSNPKYLRSWVRTELVPTMAAKSPRIQNNVLNFLAQTPLKQYTQRTPNEKRKSKSQSQAHSG